jgi:hypothetical protein
MRRTLQAAATLVVGVAASSAMLVPAAHAAPSTAKGQLKAVLPAQASAFRALRAAATPASELPAIVQRFAEGKMSTEFGVDVSQARRVTAPDGTRWDILPGTKGICLFVESEDGGVCTSTADAKAGKLSLSILPPPAAGSAEQTSDRETKAGLVPDSVTATTAVLGSGKVTAAGLSDSGLYRLASASGVDKLTLARPNKTPLTFDKQSWNKLGANGALKRVTAKSASLGWLDIPTGGGNYTYDSAGLFAAHWLTVHEVDAHSVDGRSICVNAQNQDGTWAGNALCGLTPAHSYNGSVRRGIICANGGGNYVYGYGTEWIY